MSAWGALIMSFFGAVFVALTLYWQLHLTGPLLALPFLGFALIALAAALVIRQPGTGVLLPPKAEKAVMWATIGEGVGLFLAANFAINLHRQDLLLPAMALVVGLHFLPIGLAAAFRPFLLLGGALILAAVAGFLLGAPTGGEVAGLAAALALWTASMLAILRDRRAKRQSPAAAS
jgi:hypothetical protein